MPRRNWLALAVLAPVAFALSIGLARAQDAAQVYRGKTLVIYSGNSPGGAYSAYARLVSESIGQYIPGKPTTVLKFMQGATGLVLANWLYNVAPHDGLAFGGFPERIAIEPLVAPQSSAKYDGRRFAWIGSLGKESGVCFTWSASGIKTIDDAKTRVVPVGSSGADSADSIMPNIMNAMLGTKFKIISGYGGADILVAMERGEVEGRCGFGWASMKATRPDWIRDGKINVLSQFAVVRHPDLPDVPLLSELAGNPRDKRALELYFTPAEMGRPFAAPPGVPAALTEVLRRAFDQTAKDPELLAKAEKMQLEIEPISGEQVAKYVDELYAAPADIMARVTEFRDMGGAPGKE